MLPGVSLNLDAGERVIFEGHPSWRAILGFYLRGILLSAALGAVVALATEIGGDVNKSMVFVVVLVAIGVTLLTGFIKRGIISREVQQTRLERVQNVNYNQTLFQRIVQVGDVDFDTAGSGDYDFSFDGVGDPEDVVAKVHDAQSIHDAGPAGIGEPGGATASTEAQPTQQQPPQQQ